MYLTLDTDNVDPEGNESVWHNGKARTMVHVAKISVLIFSMNIIFVFEV